MAAIDYWNIETTIRDTIATGIGSASNVYVTAEVVQPMDTSRPWVAVYLKNRTAPAEQPIAKGTRQRYSVEFSIWCWVWTLNKPEVAAEARDDLIGTVESILMGNRKMSDTIENGTIHGGEFGTAEHPKTGTLLGGEIIFRADVTATI